MAKTSLDNELIEQLAALKAEIEKLEDEYEVAQRKLAQVRELETKAETLGYALTDKRKEWDEAISELPKNLQGLFVAPRIREQVKSPKQKATGGKGKEAVTKWLQDTLADGAMTEANLRAAYAKHFGEGKRLRISTYVTAKVVKQSGEMFSLK
jgi:DNA repair ATPase RecN